MTPAERGEHFPGHAVWAFRYDHAGDDKARRCGQLIYRRLPARPVRGGRAGPGGGPELARDAACPGRLALCRDKVPALWTPA